MHELESGHILASIAIRYTLKKIRSSVVVLHDHPSAHGRIFIGYYFYHEIPFVQTNYWYEGRQISLHTSLGWWNTICTCYGVETISRLAEIR